MTSFPTTLLLNRVNRQWLTLLTVLLVHVVSLIGQGKTAAPSQVPLTVTITSSKLPNGKHGLRVKLVNDGKTTLSITAYHRPWILASGFLMVAYPAPRMQDCLTGLCYYGKPLSKPAYAVIDDPRAGDEEIPPGAAVEGEIELSYRFQTWRTR